MVGDAGHGLGQTGELSPPGGPLVGWGNQVQSEVGRGWVDMCGTGAQAQLAVISELNTIFIGGI